MNDKEIKVTGLKNVIENAGAICIDGDILLLDRLRGYPFRGEPSRLDFILMVLCTRGSVDFRVDMEERRLRANDFAIVSENHVVDRCAVSADAEGMCIALSVDFYHEIIRNVSELSALFLFSRNQPVLKLSANNVETFSIYFSSLQKKIGDTSNHYRRNLVTTLMLAMFYDLSNVVYQGSSEPDTKRHSRADQIFTNFIRMVEENCRKERRVSWYASQLSITSKYLSETVKAASKRTPNQWIDYYVTLEIRVLLKTSTKSIKEISKELSFPNQSFLGKYFKEHVGMSPSKYRRS